MKRLITALAALAGAFGLQAASFSDTGTSFEPDETPPTEASTTNFGGAVTNQGELVSGAFWNLPELSDSVEVKLVTDTNDKSVTENGAVTKFASTNHYATLSISTGTGAEVVRYAKDGGAAVNLGGDDSGVTGTSLHFDSLVKFTAYDQAMDAGTVLGSDGKIAVWVRENLDDNGDPVSTNLIVSAGYVNDEGVVTPTNYVCTYMVPDGSTLCDWHRVSIKAMQTIAADASYPGFAIAIDGDVIGTGLDADDKGFGNLEGGLTGFAEGLNLIGGVFPSAIKGQNDASVKAVAFKGMGEVDDLVFTEDECGIKSFEESGSINIMGDEKNIAGFTYTLGGTVSGSGTVVGSRAEIDFTEGMTVTISDVQIVSGSENVFSGITATGGATVDDMVISDIADMATITLNTVLGGAMVDGNAYATAADAFDAINNGEITPTGTDPITVTLLQSVAEGVKFDAADVTVVLNLAGKTIAADQDESDAAIYFAAGNLVIIDSVGGGVVDGSQMVENEPTALITDDGVGSLVISNGTFIGNVTAADACPAEISGGRFDTTYNSLDPDSDYSWIAEATLPEGYEFVEGTDDDAGYYVLQQIIEWTVTYLDEADDTYEASEKTVRNGRLATGPETEPVRDGYTLAGWQTRTITTADDPETDEDETEYSYEDFDLETTPITTNITLYAKWAEVLDPKHGVTNVTVDDVEDEADAEAKAKKSISVPAEASASVQSEAYADYFLYGVTDNQNGTYRVAITGIVETVETSVAESAVKRLTDSEATAIDVPAGLYYRITPSASLPINGTAAVSGLSTTGSVVVTPVRSEGGSKGFIKVELSPTSLQQ